MIQHTAAVKARIEGVPAVATKTYISVAPRDAAGKLPPTPFCVIHPVDGIDEQARYTGPKTTQNPRWTIHIVGSSYAQVAEVTKLIKARFVVAGRGVTLAVAGEVLQPCWWESPVPTQLDADVKPPVVFNVAELGFRSDIFA